MHIKIIISIKIKTIKFRLLGRKNLVSLPRSWINPLAVFCLFYSTLAIAEPLEYYFPDQPEYQQNIPTPESVIGFQVGSRHVRHDQLLNYFDQLSDASDNVKVSEIGLTTDHRKQVIATISSQKNLNNLSKILADRALGKEPDPSSPAVVWLGYSIHGNEISGANASMLVAYYLAAANTPEINDLLDNVIVVIEPSMNPDGMGVFTTWANSNRNVSLNTDPQHRTHIRQWPAGRTNHFMFDLNRDWLPLTQTESQNRVRNFHLYKPNVMADFHEMGKDSSYFFQPGVATRTNPLTPAKNIELTKLFATYHAKALDAEKRFYYSEESFDDFYYGKGSTYPDINGTVGILFEQASSRGYATDSVNGVLTFGFGIKNHVLTSFSTLTAAYESKEELHNFRKDFYRENIKLAKAEDFDGYVISEANDQYRLDAFLTLLKSHQISSYPLTRSYKSENIVYPASSSFYVPLNQPQYRLIKTIFSKVTKFNDNTFYDVSGWTLPLAYNLTSKKVGSAKSIKVSNVPWYQSKTNPVAPVLTENTYAYAFSWQNYLAPKLLNTLLNEGIVARVATKEFNQLVDGKQVSFLPGTIMIPAGLQQNSDWFNTLSSQANALNIKLNALQSGLTPTGIDLGSPSMLPLSPVKVLLIGGDGVFSNEAGHMLHYLDKILGVPVTIIETQRLKYSSLDSYTHIFMVDGEYSSISPSTVNEITAWVKRGGTIYGQRRAANWLAAQHILNATFIDKKQINALFDGTTLSYADKQSFNSQKRIAGTIFNANIDITHPLAFGYDNPTMPIFKNSNTIIEAPKAPFISVVNYQSKPLLSGFSDSKITDKVANNSAIVAHNVGQGKVIASADNLVFRGYWLGTSKIVANTLFFSNSFNATAPKPTVKVE